MMRKARADSTSGTGRASEGAPILINRAPVLTLWAAIVAQRLGFERDEALTLGRVVAGLNAYAKGRSLGIFKPTPQTLRRERERTAAGATWQVDLLHRAVPVMRTAQGLRAVSKDKPVSPESVQRYLESKFGASLDAVEQALQTLARSLTADELASRAYELYEAFRPDVPAGAGGWGAAGVLDLSRVLDLARG